MKRAKTFILTVVFSWLMQADNFRFTVQRFIADAHFFTSAKDKITDICQHEGQRDLSSLFADNIQHICRHNPCAAVCSFSVV